MSRIKHLLLNSANCCQDVTQAQFSSVYITDTLSLKAKIQNSLEDI